MFENEKEQMMARIRELEAQMAKKVEEDAKRAADDARKAEEAK